MSEFMILFSYFFDAITACHSKQEILHFDNGDRFSNMFSNTCRHMRQSTNCLGDGMSQFSPFIESNSRDNIGVAACFPVVETTSQ